MFADQALERFVAEVSRTANNPQILDIGSGTGEHAREMEMCDFLVECVDLQDGRNYLTERFPLETFDGIWMSHILEHVLDVHSWLYKVFYELKPGGVLAVTVPPAKHEIVGGHVSLWNEGLLCYRLILAGFDCSQARVGAYGYNLSVIVRKKQAYIPALAMDNGDIERLASYFPVPFAQNTRGDFGNVRW